MSTEHIDTLKHLARALDAFLESGATSELDQPDEPLDVEDVLPGSAVYYAVQGVQEQYPGGKLPAPKARNPWRLLLKLARSDSEPFNLQNDMHELAGALRDWAEGELAALQKAPAPEATSSAEESFQRFVSAYAEAESDRIYIVAAQLDKDRHVGPARFEEIRSKAGPSLTFLGTLKTKDRDRSTDSIGLFLHWFSDPDSVDVFKQLASEAGAIVLANDLIAGMSNATSPTVLWATTVYATLRGTDWQNTIAEGSSAFHAFAASIETWKRLLEYRQPQADDIRVFLDDIDSFEKVRSIEAISVSNLLDRNGCLDLEEDVVQSALEEILDVPFHKKDWGGEENDLYTANLVLRGRRTPTAFMLKGRGTKRATLEIANCGKNGDQLVRLFQSPASLFVIQFVGEISESVIKDAVSKARLRQSTEPSCCCFMNGQDTARLLRAYGKL